MGLMWQEEEIRLVFGAFLTIDLTSITPIGIL